MLRFFVVQDHKENRRKCTVEPLRGLEGLDLHRLPAPRPREEPLELPGGLLLCVDGAPLAPEDVERLDGENRVVVLDATWARLPSLTRRLAPAPEDLLRRSLPVGLVSAYPRVSKLFEDPDSGLATIEALFATSVVLGRPRPELLDRYRWRSEFLERNAEVLERWGWAQEPSSGVEP